LTDEDIRRGLGRSARGLADHLSTAAILTLYLLFGASSEAWTRAAFAMLWGALRTRGNTKRIEPARIIWRLCLAHPSGLESVSRHEIRRAGLLPSPSRGPSTRRPLAREMNSFLEPSEEC